MKSTKKIFKYNYIFILIALLVGYFILVPTLKVEQIKLTDKNFSKNNVYNQKISSKLIKVGKNLDSGIYDAYFETNTIVNGVHYAKGLNIKNVVLNEKDYFEVSGVINLTKPKGIECENLNFNGTCLAKESKTYEFKEPKANRIEDGETIEITTDISINDKIYGLDDTESKKNIEIKKGDLVKVSQWDGSVISENKIVVKELNEK